MCTHTHTHTNISAQDMPLDGHLPRLGLLAIALTNGRAALFAPPIPTALEAIPQFKVFAETSENETKK